MQCKKLNSAHDLSIIYIFSIFLSFSVWTVYYPSSGAATTLKIRDISGKIAISRRDIGPTELPNLGLSWDGMHLYDQLTNPIVVLNSCTVNL